MSALSALRFSAFRLPVLSLIFTLTGTMLSADVSAAVTSILSVSETNANSTHSKDGAYAVYASISGYHQNQYQTRVKSKTIYEKTNGGAWVNRGSTSSFSRASGVYSYYANVCYEYYFKSSFFSYGWWNNGSCSNTPTKTITVTKTPGTPSSISPGSLSAFGGNYTVSWGSASGANRYVLDQRTRSASGSWSGWSQVYNGSSRSKSFSAASRASASKLQYRVKSYYTASGKTSSHSGYRNSSELTVPSAPSFRVSNASVSEGGVLRFTVTKSGSSAITHTVKYATANGSGGSSDYTPVSGTLSFSASQTTKTVSVTTREDSIYEPSETLKLNLSAASSSASIADSQGIGTITNDDAAPSFKINNASVSEGGVLRFTVTKSGASAFTHTVKYATANGSGGGADYVSASGTLSFSASQTAKTVSVTTKQDSIYESSETLKLNLSAASGSASIADSQGIGTITNNDAAPSFKVNNVSVAEGGNLRFTVTKSGASAFTHTIKYATANGSGGSSDYVPASGTLSFSASESTKTVSVTTRDDSIHEQNETLKLNLSAASGSASIADSQGIGTIISADAAPEFKINNASVSEGGELSFVVTKVGASAVTHTIKFASAPGSAISSDFTAKSGTLSFSPTSYSQTVKLKTTLDSLPEDDETVYINLSSASNGAIIMDNQGLGRIIDESSAYAVDTTSIAPVIATPSVSHAELLASDAAITTGGEFSVNESGAASYSVPIMTFQGVAGVAPQVALSYSSQGGNGIAGVGWSISGLSAISRCRQTRYQDGNAKPITWTNDDRFCLDGQRLMVQSGTYGSSGSTYKTEIDSFVKVTAHGGVPGDPSYFTVKHKDGSTSYFGNSSDSSLDGGNGKTLTWAINRMEDNVGNPMTFHYSDDTDGHRIYEVRYAYDASESTHNAHVRFEYESRDDTAEFYIAGQKFNATQRLKAISSYNNDIALRRYNLRYNEPAHYDDVDIRTSRLTSIKKCKGSQCLPHPLTFEWSLPKKEYVNSHKLILDGADKKKHIASFTPIDIDGDAYMDLAWVEVRTDSSVPDTERYQVKYSLNIDGINLIPGLEGGTHLGFYKKDPVLSVIDFNADGRQDLVVSSGSNAKIFPATPINNGKWALLASATHEAPGSNAINTYADLNGDGLADYYGKSTDSRAINVRYLEPRPNALASSDHYYHFGEKQNIDVVFEEGSDWRIRSIKPWQTDINGDGVIDIMLQTAKETMKTCTVPGGSGYYNCPEYSQTRNDFYTIKHTSQGAVFKRLLNTNFALDIYHRSFVDINNDGLVDVLELIGAQKHYDSEHRLSYWKGGDWHYRANTGSGFTASKRVLSGGSIMRSDEAPTFIDFNQDGYLDMVTKRYQYPLESGWGNVQVALWLPEDQEFGLASSVYDGGLSDNASSYSRRFVQAVFAADMDGDGNADLGLYQRIRPDESDEVAQLIFVSINPDNKPNLLTRITNSYGAERNITYKPLPKTENYSRVKGTSSTKAIKGCDANPTGSGVCWDYIISVPDMTEFYRGINEPFADLDNVQDQSKAPVLEFMAPVYVVTHATTSTPSANDPNADSSITYLYEQAKIQASGRGMLGFKSLTTIDNQRGIRTKTTYRQDWPFIGSPLSTEIRADNGTPSLPSDDKLLSRSENTMSLYGLKEDGIAVLPYQPYIESGATVSYKTSVSSDTPSQLFVSSEVMQKIDTETRQDGYGNVTRFTTWTNDVGGSGQTIKKEISSDYGSSIWEKQMGRLTRAVTKTTRGTDSQTRVASFRYRPEGHSQQGLLYEEVIQPEGGINQKLTTTYVHDNVGNIIKKTVSGHDGEKNISRINSSAYDSIGRYLQWEKNHYGQFTSHVLARNDYGLPTRSRGINDAEVRTYYTPMGQPYFVASPDGSWKQTLSKRCGSACPNGAVLSTEQRVAGGGHSLQYMDLLGRVIRTAERGFKGNWIKQDSEYDILGQAIGVSDPYEGSSAYGGGRPGYWTTTAYDILGRAITVTTSDGAKGHTDYHGYQTTATNDIGQSRIETSNGLGELVKVEDEDGGTLTYSYDAESRLKKVVAYGNSIAGGVSSTITTTLGYDALGRKTSMSDPDKGNWAYVYNAFGELRSQIDGNGQVRVLSYDPLGRMVKRIDKRSNGSIEGTTIWAYYNGISGNGRGQLSSVNYNGSYPGGQSVKHIGTPTYDHLGRVIETKTDLGVDGVHYSKASYDALGRSHQVFDSARQGRDYTHTAIRNLYNSQGYLYKVVDAEESTNTSLGVDHPDKFRQIYYEVKNTDVRGNVTEYFTGDLHQTVKRFNARTGLVESIKVDDLLGSGHKVLELDTQWDKIGNLNDKTTVRRNNNGSLLSNVKEAFTYDNLNRLTDTHVIGGGRTAIRYDSFGNIKSKLHYNANGSQNSAASAGIYTYGYSNAGPHAVTKTSMGNLSYVYDNNGNMTGDSSRSLQYTTFDKPFSIKKGSHTTRFAYGPDRARYKRTDTNSDGTKTTLYLGGVEKITNTDGTKELKRYINGVAIVTQSYSTAGQLTGFTEQYLHKDHLGSITLITEFDRISGAYQAQQLDFDSWGQRRDAMNKNELSHSSLISFDTTLTTRGFTSHEMLDDVGLIHMNGRIYDQKLGRFMQADPFIQASTNTQSYNRYSYVLNNPLNATDPSGFISHRLRDFGTKLRRDAIRRDSKIFGKDVVNTVGTIAAAYVGFGVFSAFTVAAWNYDYSRAMGATSEQAFSSAFISGIFASFSSGIGTAFDGNLPAQALGHGIASGTQSYIQGGKFGHGFASAFLSKLAMAGVNAGVDTRAELGAGYVFGRVALAALLGGTISEATGGKFANGALSAAMVQLLNAEEGNKKGVEHDEVMMELKEALGDEKINAAILKAMSAASVEQRGRESRGSNQNIGAAVYIDSDGAFYVDDVGPYAAEGFRRGANDFAGMSRELITDAAVVVVEHVKWETIRNGYLTNEGIVQYYKALSGRLDTSIIASSSGDFRRAILYNHMIDKFVILRISGGRLSVE